MLLLACVLLYVAFPNRVNRAFALYLVLRGMINILGALASPSSDGLVERLAPYYQLGATWAFLHFAVVFYETRVLGRASPSAWARAASWTFLLGAVGTEIFYAATHAERAVRYVEGIRAVLSCLLVLFLAHRATTLADARRRASAMLLAVGLGLDLVYLGVYYTLRRPIMPLMNDLPITMAYGPEIESVVLYVLLNLTLIPLFAAIALLLARRAQPGAKRAAAALCVAALSGVVNQVIASFWGGAAGRLAEQWIDGLWTIAFPILVAYAVLRHSMFDVDVRTRLMVQRGSVGAVILAVAFVAAELVSNLLNATFGVLAGSVAAGVMFLMLEPLQRAGRRLADAAVPQVHSGDRIATYREAVEIAYSDGALSPKDRKHLELARTRLGLSPGDAHALEAEVAARIAA